MEIYPNMAGIWNHMWNTKLGLVSLLLVIMEGVVCDEFVWKTGPWSECMHYSCGDGGIQRREVWCAHETGWATLQSNCHADRKPHSQQSCFHICEYHKYHYVWKTASWKECRPKPGNRGCEDVYGLQRRDVTCVTKCGDKLSQDYICSNFEPKPSTMRICKLKCPENCVMTNFGSWSSCDNCWVKNSTRFRTILSLPKQGGRNCTDLVQTKSCNRRSKCSGRYKSYRYKIGKWSLCEHLNSKKWRQVRDYLGTLGQRQRQIHCLDETGSVVNERFCESLDKPETIELCVLPRECLVSIWTNWTLERVPYERNTSRDYVSRSRHVMQLPRETGSQCPSLHEERLARLTEIRKLCFRYDWIMGNWSRCVAQHEDETCGTGVQFRNSICIRESDKVPVQSHMCDPPFPGLVRTCQLPCPMDCVVSEWSEWGECLPHRCKLGRGKTKAGYRLRSRRVLRDGSYGGKSCPHLKEMQPCQFPPCYTWRVTPSNHCKMKYYDMQCGEGMMNRSAECMSRRGAVVSSRLCYDPKPSIKEVCYVACDNDCVTSEWSDWTECTRTCGVRRQSGFRTRQKTILAHPTSGGAPCPPLRMLEEKMRCNEYPCVMYYWLPEEYGICDIGSRLCGTGVQSREVHCYSDQGEKLQAKRCPSEERPQSRRNCTVTCPRGCSTTRWSDWSSCPVTCYSERTIEDAYQTRHRFIMDEPEEGGRQCPELQEQRPCPSLPKCTSYRWHVSSWSQCIFPHHYHKCGAGYRARVVRCLEGDSQNVPEEFCIHHIGKMPEVTQPCKVTCDVQVCKFSEWSEFSTCPRKCGGHRVRTRTMEGYTSKIAECYDRTRYPLEERYPCPCTHYTPGPLEQWSHCVLDPDFDPHKGTVKKMRDGYAVAASTTEGYCGIGRRVQVTVCRDNDGNNSSATVCGQKDFMEEMCFIPCPRDCQMSVWSEWSNCIVDKCGNGYQNRSRYMEESELDGGRQCPPLIQGEEYESRPCHISCDRYVWTTGDWSGCVPLQSLGKTDECGAGLQSRSTRCMKKVGDGEEDIVEVEDDLCDKLSKPTDHNYCHVPCPGQCVVTEWTPWTTCPQTCDSRNRRVRTRQVVRRPAKGSGTKCPHLQETENCQEGGNCFRYNWRWSPWGACILDQGAICGRGRRLRYKECVRGHNGKVENALCEKYLGNPILDPSEEDCIVPCPVDCIVSKWTDWTPCSATCGLGFRYRTRQVLVEPAHRGRLCPEPLIQKRPCPFADCYKWTTGSWSNCKLQSRACGYGLKTRSLICMRHDDNLVEPSHCSEVDMPHEQLKMECLEPCPGDCHMSEWSEWSNCHRPCTPEGDQVGTQTRSRAVLQYPVGGGEPCSPEIWQSRQCQDGPCVSYSWHASPWVGERRDIWCESSDGIKVTGGCRNEEQPPTQKSCYPSCTVPHTECLDVNVCGCENGYRPVFEDGLDIIVKCIQRMEGKNFTKNGDMTAENMALYYPQDGPTNFWMYAVIAAGSAFIIFVVVALYTVCKGMREEQNRNRLNSTVKSSEANSALLPPQTNSVPPYQTQLKDPDLEVDTPIKDGKKL